MNRIVAFLAFSLAAIDAIAWPSQAARGEVVEDVRYGPSCEPNRLLKKAFCEGVGV